MSKTLKRNALMPDPSNPKRNILIKEEVEDFGRSTDLSVRVRRTIEEAISMLPQEIGMKERGWMLVVGYDRERNNSFDYQGITICDLHKANYSSAMSMLNNLKSKIEEAFDQTKAVRQDLKGSNE